MGKLTIQEIAAVLQQRNGFDKREANSFVSTMFQIIQERLDSDGIVKIKGLGTFKMIDVEARESISVRTGERVVIDGHAKVAFTPDATMKELVNRPFSQFETVVLNDGVEFSDLKEQVGGVDDDLHDEQEEEPVVAAANQPVEQPVEQETEQIVEEEPKPVEEFAFDEEESHSWGRWLLGALGVLALMALSAYGGYYYGTHQLQTAVAQVDTIVVHDTIMAAPVDTLTEVQQQPAEQLAEQPATKPAEQPAPQPQADTKKLAEESADMYAQKDERVRLGAYRIVGTSHEVKVLAGQTFKSICKAHLGPDMECYVEVFNDLPKNPKVKEGQVIKIPKLQLKKKKS